MDRNVFGMIAGTVFLLFIIVGVIQMQTAMVREAAGSVNQDYAEATFETAGTMHVLNHEDNKGFGRIDEDDLNNAIENDGDVCSLLGVDGFKNQFNEGPLMIDGYYFDKASDCRAGGYVRSVPVLMERNSVAYVGVERDG